MQTQSDRRQDLRGSNSRKFSEGVQYCSAQATIDLSPFDGVSPVFRRTGFGALRRPPFLLLKLAAPAAFLDRYRLFGRGELLLKQFELLYHQVTSVVRHADCRL